MQHGSVLRIEPVRAARDNGDFECVADNGIGNVTTATAMLEVYPEDQLPAGYPSISESPTLKAVEKDRNTIMVCVAGGNPEPNVMWLKDFIPVDLQDPRLTLLPSGALRIRSSQESDEGKYECVAENSAGVVYSYGANLYVRVRRVLPRFVIPPRSYVEVSPGGAVNLTCVAVGTPMPYVKWRLGAVELTEEENIPIGRNVLQLTDIQESANFTCVATSDLGNIEFNAEVRVKAVTRGELSEAISYTSPTLLPETETNSYNIVLVVAVPVVLVIIIVGIVTLAVFLRKRKNNSYRRSTAVEMPPEVNLTNQSNILVLGHKK